MRSIAQDWAIESTTASLYVGLPFACWLGIGDVQFATNKADGVLAHLAETVLRCSKVGKVGRG